MREGNALQCTERITKGALQMAKQNPEPTPWEKLSPEEQQRYLESLKQQVLEEVEKVLNPDKKEDDTKKK